MTALGRFARRQLERLLDRWREGPEPPVRLRERVRLFRHARPYATAAEWEAFAVKLAGDAWRDAFARGFEWQERCWPDPSPDPAEVAAENERSVAEGDPELARLLDVEPNPITPEQRRLIRDLARSPWGVRIEFRED